MPKVNKIDLEYGVFKQNDGYCHSQAKRTGNDKGKSGNDPLKFKFGYFQSDGAPVFYATKDVVVQGSSNAGLGLLTSRLPLYDDAGMTISDVDYVTVNKPEPATFEKLKNCLSQNFDLLKLEAESLTDTALGKLVIDNLRNTFSIGKQSAPSLGPAGTLEVRVDTTPGSVIRLKGVAKVFGGVVSLGQTSYDVYVDYKTFGFSENFAKVAAADIGTTVVVALGSGAAVTFGAPVIAVSVAGGFTIYYVNQKFINPLKESLKGQQ